MPEVTTIIDVSENLLDFAAGINFYTYANNNPVNGNDPSGKDYHLVGTPQEQTTLQAGITALAATAEGSAILSAIAGPKYNIDVQITSARQTEYAPGAAGALPGQVPPTVGTVFINQNQLATSYFTFRADDTANVVLRQLSVAEALAHEFGHALSPSSSNSLANEHSIMSAYENPVSFEMAGLRRASYGSTTDPNQFGSSVLNADQGSSATQYLDTHTALFNPLHFNLSDNGSVATDPGSAFDPGAAGGFLLYPNMPNNNNTLTVYHK